MERDWKSLNSECAYCIIHQHVLLLLNHWKLKRNNHKIETLHKSSKLLSSEQHLHHSVESHVQKAMRCVIGPFPLGLLQLPWPWNHICGRGQ